MPEDHELEELHIGGDESLNIDTDNLPVREKIITLDSGMDFSDIAVNDNANIDNTKPNEEPLKSFRSTEQTMMDDNGSTVVGGNN